MELSTKALVMISGHFGSGKSEFAVNYALASVANRPTTLVDLDIINPYFRSVEQSEMMKKAGISVITSSLGGMTDLPALPASVAVALAGRDEERLTLVDLGGDQVGCRVLRRYQWELSERNFDFWLVLNRNRPETSDPEKATRIAEAIEFEAGQKLTGIINNTHLLGESNIDDVLRGEELAMALAERLQLPLLASTVPAAMREEAEQRCKAKVFPITVYLKKPWEAFTAAFD